MFPNLVKKPTTVVGLVVGFCLLSLILFNFRFPCNVTITAINKGLAGKK